MNNSQIKWRILKALNALYENGKTPSTILSDGFVDYLTHTRRLLRRKLSNANYLEPCNGFAAYYEKNFKTDFQNAEQFLSAAGLEHDARRSYTLNDINTLQFIAANKSELQQSLTTLRTFSSRFSPTVVPNTWKLTGACSKPSINYWKSSNFRQRTLKSCNGAL